MQKGSHDLFKVTTTSMSNVLKTQCIPLSLTLLVTLTLSTNFISTTAFAHGDDDHGAAAPAMNQTVAPRTSAVSEEFELVAILSNNKNNAQLLIYLDQFATNQAVSHVTVEVEGKGLKAIAKEIEVGVYVVNLPQNYPEKYALNFTISSEDSNDLLSAILDSSSTLISDEHTEDHKEESASAFSSQHILKTLTYLAIMLAALSIVIAIGYWGYIRSKTKQTRF